MWTTSTKSVKPSAPKLNDIISQGIYGCEHGCDVVFLVGQDETWRIPAHKTILKNATPVFRAMFSEHFFPQGEHLSEDGYHTIQVPDVEGKAFDNLLRHLYAQEVTFQSVETALRTLFAAHKYQVPELVQRCIEFLNMNLNASNILPILSNIPLLCGNVQNLENWDRERQMMQKVFLSSSREEQDVDNLLNFSQLAAAQNPYSDYLDNIEMVCASLLHNCLNFVDKEANSVLQLDEMEDLDADTFRLILSRDTLDISDENLVFNVILKWTDKECKRQQLPLTTESKRIILGESLFLPRYLTMTLQSFLCELGPAKSGLFTTEEVECFTRILKNGIKSEIQALSPDSSPQNNPMGIPPSLRPYYRMLARPRCPIRTVGHPSPAKKPKRGLNIIERWNHRRCCKSRRNWSPRSNNSSQLSSPANSNPSSPRRNLNAHNESKKWNVCVEKVVIFLACLFD